MPRMNKATAHAMPWVKILGERHHGGISCLYNDECDSLKDYD